VPEDSLQLPGRQPAPEPSPRVLLGSLDPTRRSPSPVFSASVSWLPPAMCEIGTSLLWNRRWPASTRRRRKPRHRRRSWSPRRRSHGSSDLPALWGAADDSGRRLLTEALFEKVEVLGVQSVTIHPTPEADAYGWSDAFGSVPLLLNAGRASSTDGRGERISADTFQLSVRIVGGTEFRFLDRVSDIA
jgi:hypothetical protein